MVGTATTHHQTRDGLLLSVVAAWEVQRLLGAPDDLPAVGPHAGDGLPVRVRPVEMAQ